VLKLARVFAVLMLSFSIATFAVDEQRWKLNLKEADIRAFISQVADMTGRSFVIDPRVKGRVTIVSSSEMTTKEVYEVFLSVLNVHGFAAVPSGDVVKIIQQNSVKQDGSHLDPERKEQGEQFITRVISIQEVPALDLVPILRPLVAKYGHLAGVKSANSLIISDTAVNIERIEEIIKRLDKAGTEHIEVIELKEAWVADVVKMLQTLDPDTVAKGNVPTGRRRGADPVRVVADERSNRLIMRGERSNLDQLAALVRQLDQPTQRTNSTVVIRLKHADAKKLSEILKGILDSKKSGNAATKGKEEIEGKSSVHADEALNALVVRAAPSELREIRQIVTELDVRRAQVHIEAAIVEVSLSGSEGSGVEWAIGDENQPATIMTHANDGSPGLQSIAQGAATSVASGGSAALGAAAALKNGFYMGGGSFDKKGNPELLAILRIINSESNTNILSTPSILTLDNELAKITVGQNVPFKTAQESSTNTTNPITQIKREDVGLTLEVTPHVHDERIVRLEVKQTTDSISNAQVAGVSDIVTNKRSIETQVMIEDGQIIALGGLIKDDIKQGVSKVPFLGDIPLLGALFRSQFQSHEKTNLMVFLKPTIVLDRTSTDDIAREKYLGVYDIELSGDLDEGALEERFDDLFKGKKFKGNLLREE
jgi:general secretion pathway protein D